MLVLTRCEKESVVIGDHIRVVVLEVRGGRTRLGIEAPAEVPVHRHEIYAAIRREKASGTDKVEAFR